MLTSVADWTTEDITHDPRRDVQILTVVGDYRNCDPDALRRSLGANVGVLRDDVFADRSLLAIVAPMGTFKDPADYRAWVDEGISEAERETVAMLEAMRESARIAADNIALLAADARLSTDAIMRAAMVCPESADAIMGGESLPIADLTRIATALGVHVESLLTPGAQWT